MRTEFGPKDPPNAKEIAQMWRELTITHVEMKHAAIDALLERLRKTHSNGDAEFACLAISKHPALDWFVYRNRFASAHIRIAFVRVLKKENEEKFSQTKKISAHRG